MYPNLDITLRYHETQKQKRKFFSLSLGFETWSPGAHSQCATNELCLPLLIGKNSFGGGGGGVNSHSISAAHPMSPTCKTGYFELVDQKCTVGSFFRLQSSFNKFILKTKIVIKI